VTYLQLIFDNARRNLLRTSLTALGTIVLVCIVTLVWSVLEFLQNVTTEKTSNIKAIVTERWRIPSQMPYAYAEELRYGAAREAGDIQPQDYMSWTFYGGSIDKEKRTRENSLFAFCLEPEKLITMMDELDELRGAAREDWVGTVERLKSNPQGIILGSDRIKAINKRVGDRFTLYSLNYKEVDLEVEVVGVFPLARYSQSAAMNIDYFNRALFDAYPLTHNGQAHPMAEKSMNLFWVKVPNSQQFTQIATQIQNSPSLGNPDVKVETAASGISTFLEAYRDLIAAMRWVLGPAIIVTLAIIISNAISISVRERRMEFAIMKVLGFRPLQILLLVIGEALLIGATSGILSGGLTYGIVNKVFGGVPFPIAFFPAFMISQYAPLWGISIGAGAALAGSFLPAWQACRVKVAEVFGRVA
jgi:putative ABC transport system permease protein